MKKSRSIILLTTVILTSLLFTSCIAVVEPVYPVWTQTESYANYILATGELLRDGRYFTSEITGVSNAGLLAGTESMCFWTRHDITNWFISRGLTPSQAAEETAWFTTVEHGIFISRTGGFVYTLRK